MLGQGTGDSVGGPSGSIESILDYFGWVVPYWKYSNTLLTLAVGFVIILALPNVLQLFEKEKASLTKVRSAPALFRFEWQPSFLWAVGLSALALVTLLMVTGNSEFLYFKF
jgi:hypothetical protein